MPRPQTHRIRTAQFNFRAGDEMEAMRWSKVVGDRIKHADFLDRLSRRLDGLVPDDVLIHLDHLEVSIKLVDENFDEQLLDAIEQALKPLLLDKMGRQSDGQDGGYQSKGEAVLHFLKSGHLPWWANGLYIKPLEEQLEPEALEKVKELIAVRPVALLRFAQVTSTDFLIREFLEANLDKETIRTAITFLEAAFSVVAGLEKRKYNVLINKALLQTNLQKIERPNRFVKFLVQKLFASLSYSEKAKLEAWFEEYIQQEKAPAKTEYDTAVQEAYSTLKLKFISLPGSVKRRLTIAFSEILSGKPDKKGKATASEIMEEKTDGDAIVNPGTSEENRDQATKGEDESLAKELEEGLFINNTGLILLHPFLPRLFDRMGFIHEKKFKDAESQQKAIQMLGWLATGNDLLGEEALAMAKLLVGYPLSEPIELQPPMTEKATDMGGGLLKSVIVYWSKLGTTSVDGLREGFLARTGKLISEENAFRLIIEHKTHDILLESMPWGFSLVKLSWTSYLIKTEWN